MPDFGRERIRLPKVETLDTCGPGIPDGDIRGYKLVLPPREMQDAFARDTELVRVRKPRVRLPDYGGRSSATRAILPHADHFGNPDDEREALMLSPLPGYGSGGSATFVAVREAAPYFLEVEEEWFYGNLDVFGSEAQYDRRFRITEEEYFECFKPGGYRNVVGAVLARHPRFDKTITRLNILGYAIRGPTADDVMKDLMERCRGMYLEEKWDDIELIGLNNSRLLHGRKWGPKTPRQRNFGRLTAKR